MYSFAKQYCNKLYQAVTAYTFTPYWIFQTMLDDCLTAVRELLMCPAQGDLAGGAVHFRQGHCSVQPTVTSTSSVGVGDEGKQVGYRLM